MNLRYLTDNGKLPVTERIGKIPESRSELVRRLIEYHCAPLIHYIGDMLRSADLVDA